MCGLGVVAACASPAAAADGGGAGGAYASVVAKIRGVDCAAACSGFDTATAGSLLRVSGTNMDEVAKIVFLGGRGDADNITARTSKRTATFAEVMVPAKASSGPLRAVNGDGLRSKASKATVAIKIGGSTGPLAVRVIGQRVFQGAARPARIDLLASKPMTVDVALTRLSDGAAVQSWAVGALTPGTVQSVTWDGKLGGVLQPAGRYEFRVLPGSGGGIVPAAAPAPLATVAFDFVDHKFPVRGKHTFGTGVAAFGAARDGHTHQGQDVFAKCGTKLVAARGGVIKLNKFQSAAGNYLIIDGDDTDVDYGYMHLQARSPLKKGTHVMTGDEIGRVGDTGDAVGCHLHFEMWSGPGWYTGGQPFDPLPFLKVWDDYS